MTQPQLDHFEQLLEYLQESRGFDGSAYKRPSLERRMRKREQQPCYELHRFSRFCGAAPELLQTRRDRRQRPVVGSRRDGRRSYCERKKKIASLETLKRVVRNCRLVEVSGGRFDQKRRWWQRANRESRAVSGTAAYGSWIPARAMAGLAGHVMTCVTAAL